MRFCLLVSGAIAMMQKVFWAVKDRLPVRALIFPAPCLIPDKTIYLRPQRILVRAAAACAGLFGLRFCPSPPALGCPGRGSACRCLRWSVRVAVLPVAACAGLSGLRFCPSLPAPGCPGCGSARCCLRRAVRVAVLPVAACAGLSGLRF